MTALMTEPRSPTPRQRILVVEDDPVASRSMALALDGAGYDVEAVSDGRAALSAIQLRNPALVVLDIELPGADGLDLLSHVRRRSDVPVILATGRTSEADRLLGLDLGADDYMPKPIYPRELAARVQTVLRRVTRAEVGEAIVRDELVIDPATREVTVGGRAVELTAREFDLLAFLASAPRQVFSREQLLQAVWGSSGEWQEPATVTEHVRRIRTKLGDDPAAPRWIRTVRGAGYRFDVRAG